MNRTAATTPDNSASAASSTSLGVLAPTDTFVHRHIGPRESEIPAMLATLGLQALDELVDQTVPAAIRIKKPLELVPPASPSAGPLRGEREVLDILAGYAGQNRIFRSFIGMGYYDTITPPVIQRNILENPGWYTQYTPYQAEISQGRLEALLNFQTMVADLTGLPMANASLLDEATAAAEAMAMCFALSNRERPAFYVADDCHPQTIAVVKTRARSMGIEVVVGKVDQLTGAMAGLPGRAGSTSPDTAGQASHGTQPVDPSRFCGVLVQSPATDGRIIDYSALAETLHSHNALLVMATDLLALTLIKPPGEMGADIAVGSAQRFGVPMGYGGPHAAFMATKTEHARKMPGRIVGLSRDAAGHPALRLALQTREQHIRRDKATSNICTAQVLLAIMASMYAVYHGPEGLKKIARRVHLMTKKLATMLAAQGHQIVHKNFFDTLRVQWNPSTGDQSRTVIENFAGTYRKIIDYGYELGINLNSWSACNNQITIALDETTTEDDVSLIARAFGFDGADRPNRTARVGRASFDHSVAIENRATPFLTHPVFNSHHSETEMLRYIRKLEARDLSLTTSMIPLGSCTMKLNATVEMFPVTWPAFGKLHPYAPREQAAGYAKMFADLEAWLAEITGFSGVSLQPNAGSQGEYAGLLAIRGYHEAHGQSQRDICLIPTSAHGTNPASAVIAGLHVVPVACDEDGNINVTDLAAKALQYRDRLSCVMVTYPSTHGVFEESIVEICKIVHDAGGQVYMDGANMNAQVGLCRPGDIGADVRHLNLHKTFCIPHGGGGPGMGPIGVAAHLAPFLPGDPIEGRYAKVGPVSAAPYGSASILVIPWVYIALMGGAGLTRATQVAILNANYMAQRLREHYPVRFTGKRGRVAHEFIIDCRQFEATSGVKVEDIAKRLMDYGFHAPTMSWPEAGTLMIEPTESEPRGELDRLCDALIMIRAEIREIEEGRMSRDDNALKNAPHTAAAVTAANWLHPYPREAAAFPAPWTREHKFWPPVARIDNPWGDRNLVCTCPPVQ